MLFCRELARQRHSVGYGPVRDFWTAAVRSALLI